MTLALHVSATRSPARADRVGDAVADLARRYAREMNASPLALALRDRRLPLRSYRAFIATMYPVVVGFNRALIRSIAKVDHVRNASFVRALARQLEEEQAHNQLWRAMLDVFDIDHEALYDDVEDYTRSLSDARRRAACHETLLAARRDPRVGAAQHFRAAIFPDAVLALCAHLWNSAADESVTYWEHFASQAGIEMIIFDVVTTSILPGVIGHPELDRGGSSTQWWLEHGRVAGDDRRHTDEEQHLALSKNALNRSEAASMSAGDVTARAEDTMRLFAASLLAQDPRHHAFPIERYLRG